MPAKKILLIEDDEMQRTMYEIEFEHFGYKLLVAESGKRGLELVSAEKPDIVLLDLLLGDMKGVDVLRQIKNDPSTKDIKVVVMTNYFKKGLEEECRELGALDFWGKSAFVPREIVEKVESIIGK